MRDTAKCLSAAAFGLLLAAGPSLEPQSRPETAHAQAPQGQPTFRVSVDLVTTDVIVRDPRDQFIADLKTSDFEVYEDGVKQDIAQDIRPAEWNAHVRDSQDSLRVIAAETGGFAVVNMNDYDTALKRIDNETSDYYVLGYYSSNPDPLKRTRRLEVRTSRAGATVFHRTSYTMRPVAAGR